MNESSSILSVVERFYNEGDSVDGWEPIWREVMALFKAETGCIYIEGIGPTAGEVEFLAMPGFGHDALALYGQHYINVDPYAAHGRVGGETEVFLSQEIIRPSAFRETEVWRDYSSRHVGAFHILGAGVSAGPGRFARSAIHRPHDAKAFGRKDLARYKYVLPHLSRALKARTRKIQEDRYAGVPGAALDASISAIVVVDSHGRRVFWNAAAENLAVGRHLVFDRASKEIKLTYPEQTRRLREFISDVTSGGPGGSLRAVGADGLRPIAISISRLPSKTPSLQPSSMTEHHLALLTIRDIETAIALDPLALTHLFGLTFAEAEVAKEIATGVTVEDLAELRGRSVPTVRSQVRQILQKTGANSTRHLIGMLSRLPGA